MALGTFSKFYYGFEITLNNYKIDFDEGAGPLVAELTLGIYSPSDLETEIKTQLDAVGTKTYTVSFNRVTRKFSIACDTGTFSIPIFTGPNKDLAPYYLLGFTGADLSGSGSYTSNIEAGDQYKPQFWLQDYTQAEDWNEKVDSAVNQSASGFVEVISFGDVQFKEFNILFITNLAMDGVVIKNNPQGLEAARDFMNFCIKRGTIDFMPDESLPNVFYKLILETTELSSKGTGFRLKEETGKNLPGIYQTGKLKWRVVG